jgi:lipopolysaccharide/colanic/teichoic acid biosynthesis glycosyltransferase
MISVALPLAGMLTDVILFAVFHKFPAAPRDVIIYAPSAAVAIFGIHYLYRWNRLKRGEKRRIVLELLPSEKESVVEGLRMAGLDQYIEILPPSALRASFLSRTERDIDQIVISRGAVRLFRDAEHLFRAHLHGIPIVDRRDLLASLSGRIRTHDSDAWSYIQSATQQTPLHLSYATFKVWVEPVIAFLLGIVLLPVMVAVAIAIRWTSRGPVFYKQLRSGYLGRSFELVKFRSMVVDSESNGAQWAKDGDARITPVGKFIRATRLDELPQLWNVMRGEMSFFGPRPERPQFYKALEGDIPLFSMRTIIRPGITGWAQVCAGYAASVEESRTKLEFDLYYIRHVSFRLDMIVLLRTFIVAFLGSERARTQPVEAPKAEVAAVQVATQ